LMAARKLTEADVVEILARYAHGESLASIAQAFGIANGYYICEIAGRKHWAHVEISPKIEKLRRRRYQHHRGETHSLAKLTDADVRAILRRLGEGERVNSLAREFDVSRAAVQAIKDGTAWQHIEREKQLPIRNWARRPKQVDENNATG
jgi:hypothetical protein